MTKAVGGKVFWWVLAVLLAIGIPLGSSAFAASDAPAAKKRTTTIGKASGRKVAASSSRRAAASKRAVRRSAARTVRPEPVQPSVGQVLGLHGTEDPLDLKSSVALVLDQNTDEVLFSKNPTAVLPIASITKLMTAVVIVEGELPLDEKLVISTEDIDTEKGSRSRLAVGTTLSREELLHLALMASENRAAHALGRTYPGGLPAFVAAMNQKARELGMLDTHYEEPTGLSSQNQSSAHDLAVLVKAAYGMPLIRDMSTSSEYRVSAGRRQLQYRNTNRLVNNPSWDIGLQKTGYIAEAGRCLVMQAQLAGRQLIMVFLDSAGKYSRLADAERVRRWLIEAAPHVRVTAGSVASES
jgi:D-alanyl-D-alanine endopeptidase (penicillin-binding protein 7)